MIYLRTTLSLIASLIVASGVAVPYVAHADTAIATNNNLPMYFGGTLPSVGIHGGYQLSLNNLNIQVTYEATITNITTGTQITEGATVAVGTPVRLAFRPHHPNDVYWFGAGGYTDSPYGEWREDAAPPGAVTCEADDKVNNTPLYYSDSSTPTMRYNQFAAFVVDYPIKTITNTAGLTCAAPTTAADGTISQDCTVSSTGEINPNFNVGATYGNFYPRYDVVDTGGGYWPDEGCVNGRLSGTDSPMSAACGFLGNPACPTTPMILAQTILIPFTAINASDPPAAPSIAETVAASCSAGVIQPSTYTFTATDPNGDTIRYGIDWDNTGTVDEWVPSSGYVASGTSRTDTVTWTAGTHTFRVLAQDSTGVNSAWTSRTVTVAACPTTPAPTALLTASPSTVASGGSSTLTWSCSGTATSASIDQSIGALTPSDGSWAGTPNGGTRSTGALTLAKTYTLTCVGPGGQTSDTETVAIGTPVSGVCSATHYLCSAGSSTSNVEGATAWTWTCAGQYGGTSASCSEPRTSGNGVCSATHYACTAGTSINNVDGATAWTWTCQGTGAGSTNASCTENKPISGTLPNLKTTSVTVPDTEINDPITISAIIQNESATTTSIGFTNLFQIDNNTDHDTVYDSRTDTSPRLLANGTDTSQVSYTFTTPGTWYVRVCADKANQNDVDGVVDESNEADNCSNAGAWTTITVSEPSLSCDVSSFTDTNVNGDIDPGENVRFAASPSNLGASAYTWDSSNAPAESGEGSTYNISFPASGTYQMRVSASGYEDGVCSAQIGAGQCDAEDITLSATPSRVQSGAQTTLTWDIPGVDDGITQCTITSNKDDSYLVTIPIPPGQCTTGDEGSEDSHAITTQTTFTLSCGGTNASVTVDVIPVIKET